MYTEKLLNNCILYMLRDSATTAFIVVIISEQAWRLWCLVIRSRRMRRIQWTRFTTDKTDDSEATIVYPVAEHLDRGDQNLVIARRHRQVADVCSVETITELQDRSRRDAESVGRVFRQGRWDEWRPAELFRKLIPSPRFQSTIHIGVDGVDPAQFLAGWEK